MATKQKSMWILGLFLLSGIVVGGLIGELAAGISFLSWLAYGQSFGISEPVVIDLSVICLTLGCMIKINISSIIGILLALLIYRKV